MSETKKGYYHKMKDRGYIPVQVVLLPETVERFDAIVRERGLNKRSDGFKEAIADYIQKHERGGADE